jgi:hypothetical protein
MGRGEEIIYMSIQNIMNQEIALRNLERRQAFDIAVQTVEDMLSKSKELNIKYPSADSPTTSS